MLTGFLREPTGFPDVGTGRVGLKLHGFGAGRQFLVFKRKVPQLPKVWLFPFMYAFSMFAICIIIATLYRFHKRFFGRSLDIVLSEKANDKFGNSQGTSKYIITISTVETISHAIPA
ncbi:unnamed protein product [Oppiella nova]|uniref:Uncharacterized protein n=1 Tax=Oppiella nova TaxID=334625 RepID=A0A7R9LTZ5_9ACAR|nr:unnamed protein product [Oppiella nova]CAG2166935.1 unnamed protein product [Oppiella nova]